MRFFSIFLLLFIHLQSLEKQPWFGDVFEFHFLGGYNYYRYKKVQGAIDQLTTTSNNHLLFGNLEFSPSPYWDIDTDLEFADTPQQSFGFRSFAIQGRYLWFDDIIGDPISLVTGLNGRFISSRSVKDVSSPYHGNVDFEVNVAIGKELDQGGFWRFRGWGYGAIGLANKGSPWVEGLLAFEGNFKDEHKGGIYLLTAHGYGRNTSVNIAGFNGYGKIRYKFVDIAFRYGRRLGVWGTLRFEYQRRLYARLCPRNTNFFILSYLLPFSF